MKSTKLRSWTEAIFGLQPLAAPPHVFALDEEFLIYARFLAAGSGRPQLLERIVVEIPKGVLSPGTLGVQVADPDSLGRLVQDLTARLSAPVERATLLLPDSWLRMTFLDSEELPVAEDARHEVLRWKMSRLLPFKIDDLRIDAQEVEKLPGGEQPVRTVIGFARDGLLTAIESAFADATVDVGSITNRSSGLMLALSSELESASLAVVVVVEEGQYTLIAARHGEPILFRHKTLEIKDSTADPSLGILRDLRLTRGFLAERLPAVELGSVELVAVPTQRSRWQGWIAEGLGLDARFHDFDTASEGRSLSAVMGAMAGVVDQVIH